MSVGWARGLERGERKEVVMKDEAERLKIFVSQVYLQLINVKSCDKYRILPIFYST